MARQYANTPGEMLRGPEKKKGPRFRTWPGKARTHLQLNARRLARAQDVKERVLACANALPASVGAGDS